MTRSEQQPLSQNDGDRVVDANAATLDGSFDRSGETSARERAGGRPSPNSDEHCAELTPGEFPSEIGNHVMQRLFGEAAPRRRFGRYRVRGRIGSGGMGSVYRARDPELDREVAIKVLHSGVASHHTARLRREALALARLSHPNVVQVYEVGTHADQTFVVMELVRGQTLQEWMSQTPRPSWQQCVELFIQAGEGLAAAHAQGLVHRDFKPGNVIVDEQGRVRVLDFGLARQDDSSEASIRQMPTASGDDPLDSVLDSQLTQTGAVLGTPAYMSLEQVQGQIADARSDQFSFCVSLYEAVYGQRPFAGETFRGLVVSMVGEQIRSAPEDAARVPGALRRILVRGLASQPDDRWPSMDALIAELRGLIAPRGRRGLAVGVLVVAGVLGLVYGLDRAERCGGAEERLEGVWDDERRQQVQAAILGTQLAYAPRTWERVEEELDAYSGAWVEAYTDVCIATAVRHEQSEEDRSLRVHCLDERHTELDSRVRLLAEADPRTTARAVSMVAGLPLLSRCDDLELLREQQQRRPPPEDPVVAEEVERLHETVTAIHAYGKAGRHALELEEIETLLERAQQLQYGPLLAEATFVRGLALEGLGRYDQSIPVLKEAFALALEHQHDDVALDAARDLTRIVGLRQGDHDEGLMWGRTIALPLSLSLEEPVDRSRTLSNIGVVLAVSGKPMRAREQLEQALEIQESVLGAEHIITAETAGNLGNVFIGLGEFERARAQFERVLRVHERLLGVKHPSTIRTVGNLGNALVEQGEYGQAQTYYAQTLDAWQELFGAEHPMVAVSHNNLGWVAIKLRAYEDAERHHRAALKIRRETMGPEHPDIALSLSNLGILFGEQRRFDEALEHHRQALEMRERLLGGEHPDVAGSLSDLGDTELERGRPESAREHYGRARTIWESALGAEHPDVAYALVGLARLALLDGDSAVAREHAERAVALRIAGEVAPEHLAEARVVLGQALWSDPRERPRARMLVERARDALVDFGGADLSQAQAWLMEHPVGSDESEPALAAGSETTPESAPG